MQSDGTSPTLFDCGTLSNYRQLHTKVFHFMLQDLPDNIAGTAALVAPTAVMPYPFLLHRFSSHRPLFLLDPDPADLEQQRSLVGDKQVIYQTGGVADFPDSLQDLGLVLNPFGLQHWRREIPLYASAARKRSRDDGRLITLDWGRTRYPDTLADLPGIVEEVRFSEQALLPAYDEQSGWRLELEREICFALPYGVKDIIAQMSSEHAETFQLFARELPDDAIIIGGSVIYRVYGGIV